MSHGLRLSMCALNLSFRVMVRPQRHLNSRIDVDLWVSVVARCRRRALSVVNRLQDGFPQWNSAGGCLSARCLLFRVGGVSKCEGTLDMPAYYCMGILQEARGVGKRHAAGGALMRTHGNDRNRSCSRGIGSRGC